MRSGEPLRIIGSGSALGWLPPFNGRHVSTGRLNHVLDYRPDDLMVSVEAGVRLDDLQVLMERDGLCLPIPPPECGWSGYAGTTLGGLVALGLPHAWEDRTGRIADWVTGMVAIDVAGRQREFGARVAKSVAGFDFHRTLCGSRGELMAIAVLHLRLTPVGTLPQQLPWRISDPCWITRVSPAESPDGKNLVYSEHPLNVGFGIGPNGQRRGDLDPAVEMIGIRLKDLCDPAGVLKEGWRPLEPNG